MEQKNRTHCTSAPADSYDPHSGAGIRAKAASLLLGILLWVWPFVAHADSQVVKTYCALTTNYATMEELKADIEANAKRLAVAALYGEQITALTTVEGFRVTRDQIDAYAVGFVRVNDIQFYAGEDQGEHCVRITAFATEDDLARFAPQRIVSRMCKADSNLNVVALRERTRQEALIQAVIEYNPNLEEISATRLRRLVQKVKYLESDFLPGTETYCVEVEGYILPIEVMALLNEQREATPQPAPAQSPRAPSTHTPTATAADTAEQLAMAVKATLTAIAPTPTSTAIAPPTPNATATARTQATVTTRSVQATLTASAPTPTRTPTVTPTPFAVAPTATPTPRLTYHTIPLDRIANTTIREGYSNPPFGNSWLNGVKFYLSDAALNTAMTQTEGEVNARLPTTLALTGLNIAAPRSIHLLITGGNVRREFSGRQVGRVVAEFSNGQSITKPIIAGQQLREWHLAGDRNVVTTSDPAVTQAYADMRTDGVGACVIDMLTIQVPEALRSQASLTSVSIIDESVQLIGDLKPAINLLGLTILAEE